MGMSIRSFHITSCVTDKRSVTSIRYWKVHRIRLTTSLLKRMASGTHPMTSTLRRLGREPTSLHQQPPALYHIRDLNWTQLTLPIVCAIPQPKKRNRIQETSSSWILKRRTRRVRSSVNCRRHAANNPSGDCQTHR